jgi:hypothetical protein
MQRTMTPHQFEREMMCSFEAPVENSYYGDLMVAARMDGRLTRVAADPRLRTITAWDLGMKDLTSIWFGQKIGNEIRFIDFYQSSGKGLDHYARVLQEKGYLYGYHLFPHDIKVREYGTGRSRFETILSLQLPGDALIVPDHSIADGISGVRTVLPVSWFDEEKCELGIDALRSYHVQMAPSGATVRDAPAHTWASHACLTADAQVLTEQGEREIVYVRVGDRVWTPRGFATVLAAGPVKRVVELIEVTLADGRALRCTPEHKVWTSRGLVRADALRYSDRVFRGTEWPIRLAAFISMVVGIGFRATTTGETTGARQGLPTFTGRSTLGIMARSRRAMKSIIGTATHSITSLPIWNWSAKAFISSNTPSSVSPTVSFNHLPQKPWLLPQRGMGRLKVWRGTASTASRLGISGFGTTAFARAVVSRIVRLFLHAPSGATPIVKLRPYVSVGVWTYDLTIENHACYQANGFLVSNSDAMRYFAMGLHLTTAWGPGAFKRNVKGIV